MIDDKLGQQLHSRATTGQPISDKERAQLEAWHKKLDEEEEAMLARSAVSTEEMIAEMKAQMDKVREEIAAKLKRINELRQRNEQLRRENEQLWQQIRRKLGDKSPLPSTTSMVANQPIPTKTIEFPIDETLLADVDQSALRLCGQTAKRLFLEFVGHTRLQVVAVGIFRAAFEKSIPQCPQVWRWQAGQRGHLGSH